MDKLIKKCRDYDRKAQREMVNHLAPFLLGVCRRYAPTHEDARDWMQESLINIFNNIEQFRGSGKSSFMAWCKKIAVNVSLGKLRKKSMQIEPLGDFKAEKFYQPAVVNQLNVGDILHLLERLPHKLKMVFNLFVVDGYNHREIGDMLEIKESSSRTFLVRARERMQQLILSQEINSTDGK